jgi:hypothetical protein
MDAQTLINVGLGFCMAGGGWFARELWAAVKDLKSDLAKLREEIPKVYVQRDDYREDMRDIKEMFNKIMDKLELKQDK